VNTEASTATDVVLYETAGDHVAIVTLNRPEKRNAVNGALARAMDACVKRAEADPDIRVVILASSNDSVFCAGADLAEVAKGGPVEMATPDGGFAGLVDAKRRKPWIAAAKGAVLAGGLELCLACEMIVAAEDARFGLPEVKRSLVAGEGGVYRLPKVVPRAVALEMIATGDPIDARRAYEIGLVNRLAPREAVLDAAKALARSIAVNAPLAVYESIAVAKQAVSLGDEEGHALARQALRRLSTTEDYAEGPRAFVEKRAPVWKGR
jgi:enoyl-CoA hydratase/carnithine racemase